MIGTNTSEIIICIVKNNVGNASARQEPVEMASVLRPPKHLCYYECFLALFVYNVSATVSYDQKALLDIRTAITHLVLDESFLLKESDAKDLLQTPDKAQIPVIRMRKIEISRT